MCSYIALHGSYAALHKALFVHASKLFYTGFFHAVFHLDIHDSVTRVRNTANALIIYSCLTTPLARMLNFGIILTALVSTIPKFTLCFEFNPILQTSQVDYQNRVHLYTKSIYKLRRSL